MTDINIDNFFDLISDDSDVGSNDVYIDFKNTPVYWIGIYKKLILNHNKFE